MPVIGKREDPLRDNQVPGPGAYYRPTYRETKRKDDFRISTVYKYGNAPREVSVWNME